MGFVTGKKSSPLPTWIKPKVHLFLSKPKTNITPWVKTLRGRKGTLQKICPVETTASTAQPIQPTLRIGGFSY